MWNLNEVGLSSKPGCGCSGSKKRLGLARYICDCQGVLISSALRMHIALVLVDVSLVAGRKSHRKSH